MVEVEVSLREFCETFYSLTQTYRIITVAAIMVAIELALPACAYGEGPHVHGVAILEIAIDDGLVQINLNSPLDNLLGFEHAPRNEGERQAVKSMASKLYQADSLFNFTPAARCQLESAELKSPLLPMELLMPDSISDKTLGGGVRKKPGRPQALSPASSATTASSPAASSGEHADGHAELEGTWSFRCAVPQALQSVDVRLFEVFPGIRRLDTAIAGPKGQSGAKLSPAFPSLKW